MQNRRRTMETLRMELAEVNRSAPLEQRRLHSLYEAIAGTAIGFVISWALLAFIISPLFHLRTDAMEDILITTIFTVASVIRSYGVRRLFNWLHRRNYETSYPQL